MREPEVSLGKQLQAARQAAGLTQQQLCAQANLSFSTLTKIERGAIKAPSIFTIQAIAGALNLSLDELIGASATRGPSRTLSKTKSGVRFIYFDVNGCLVRFYQRAFSKLAHDTGSTLDVVESVFWQYNDEVCRGSLSISDFNAKLAERIGVEKVDWLSYYLETAEPIAQMHELVTWASEHYMVGLLTNIMPTQIAALRRSKLIPDIHYEAIIDSSEVGLIKPDPEIYAIAEQKAGVDPSEIMLIDDLRPNIMAAGKNGWKIILFDNADPESSVEYVREALQPAE